ncbi:MAG: YbaK/EbsC family protein [Candidatus Diapherotrites archaeon]
MLDEFIENTEGISAQILSFDEEVATCKQAQALEKTIPIVKTIVLTHTEGHLLAILLSNDKVDYGAIQQLTGKKEVRLATHEEVEPCTGYKVGGVPPISIYGIPTLLDEKVLSHHWVLAGGGDSFSLLKIQSNDIRTYGFEVNVARITK